MRVGAEICLVWMVKMEAYTLVHLFVSAVDNATAMVGDGSDNRNNSVKAAARFKNIFTS